MATVLGTLGFVMGLVAIWLAAETLRRGDGKSREVARPQMRALKAQTALIAAMETRIAKLERQVTESRHSESGAALANPVGPYNLGPSIPFAPSRFYDA